MSGFGTLFFMLVICAKSCCKVNAVTERPKQQNLNVFAGEEAELGCVFKGRESNSTEIVELDERRIVWEYTNSSFLGRTRSFNIRRLETHSPIFRGHVARIYTEGGEAAGTECSFPFVTYNNVTRRNETHLTCEESGKKDKRCWCSTKPFMQSPTDWGFCPCPFPMPGVTIYAEFGTDPGMPCVFPFHYKNKVYEECTREHDEDGRCWCATTKHRDDHDNNKFGFCPCAGPPNIGIWAQWDVWNDAECGQVTFRKRLCKKPDGVVSPIGVGRKLYCPGSSFEFKLFECRPSSPIEEDIHTWSLQSRTSPGKNGVAGDYGVAIAQVTAYDSGLYLCKVTGEHLKTSVQLIINPIETVASTLLNVQAKEQVKAVLLDHEQQLPTTPTLFRGYGVTYQWEPWSACNRCGSLPGEKRRAGFCYTRDVRGGVDFPCNSDMLTRNQKSVVRLLRNYVVYKTCHMACVEREKSLVKVAGHAMPPSRALAQRKLVVLDYGDNAVLECGSSSAEFPSWRFDHPTDNITYPINYMKNEVSGISLDIYGKLTVSDAADSLAGYYSCYVDYRLRRVFRILVEKDILTYQVTVEKSPPYLRLGIIAVLFLVIAIKVVTTKLPH